jgi:predicted  nucleic acid-binding Zn-ribbon protein
MQIDDTLGNKLIDAILRYNTELKQRIVDNVRKINQLEDKIRDLQIANVKELNKKKDEIRILAKENEELKAKLENELAETPTDTKDSIDV